MDVVVLPLRLSHINALKIEKVEIEVADTIACATVGIFETTVEFFITFAIGP